VAKFESGLRPESFAVNIELLQYIERATAGSGSGIFSKPGSDSLQSGNRGTIYYEPQSN
jgi:hypothetical protein